jgi:DNA end-binding protein Ku
MARAIWKGSISFGLVNIPVGVYPAEQREEIPLHLLDRKTMGRVRYKRVDEKNGKEVPWEETVRGYEVEGGHYVVLTDEDLRRASPEKTQRVDILSFVDLDEISPLYFDKPYYLAPDKSGAKSYALLRDVLKRTGKVGIASVVLHTKQYIAAVIAQDKVILLNILRYAHELRDADDLDLPTGKEGATAREVEMAERLVHGMVDSWEPESYKDTYYQDLLKVIHKRAKAKQFESAPEEEEEEEKKPAGAKVIDLMELLKQSLDKGGKKPGAKKTAAKKTATHAAKKAAPKRTAAKHPTASKRKTA